MSNTISVLIITLNESANLPKCLASLAWCNDVVVLDSCSKDDTQFIAKKAGARVVERPFDNYAAQRNFGLKEISYKHAWVLMVDADEEVPAELVDELKTVTERSREAFTLYRLRRKDFFLGRWIRRSSGYPTWFGRLVRLGNVRVEREINEEFVTDGEIGLLDNHLNHYPFNKGFAAWFEKHNSYSSMEAKLMVGGGFGQVRLADLMSKDPTIRRRGIKALIYRLPFRPLWMFLALYVVRAGFLDGRAGLVFCTLRAFYEFMIDCKVRELKLRTKGSPL